MTCIIGRIYRCMSLYILFFVALVFIQPSLFAQKAPNNISDRAIKS